MLIAIDPLHCETSTVKYFLSVHTGIYVMCKTYQSLACCLNTVCHFLFSHVPLNFRQPAQPS